MRARQVATVAVLAAASTVAMLAIRFPIVPGAPYLIYDPSDAIGLLAGFWMGPGPAVTTVFIKAFLFWVVRDGNPLGPLANFLAVGTFVGTAAWVYRRAGRPGPKALGLAVVAGAAARVAVMVGANFPILYLEFGMPPQRVAALLWPAIVPYNALASLLNGSLALVLMAALARRTAPVATAR